MPVVTVLVHGSLAGPSSNLGSRYIIVRLAACLSTSGNKFELAHQMWELCVGGGCSSKS
jgi:hypothetical protein